MMFGVGVELKTLASAQAGASWGQRKLGSGLSLSYWVFYVVFFVSLYLKEM
jgi:hypothetical protein